MHKPFIFFGTPYVASDTLAYLLEHNLRPVAVVTSPDAPRGRGLTLTQSETKVLALAHGIPVLTPAKLDSAAVAEIGAFGAEYGVVVAYGKILPEALIGAFPLGLINVHYSLLPRYRGASPVEAALRAGDETTGVTIQKLVRELDAGDILSAQEVAILPTETTRELRPRLVRIGAEMLVALLPEFETGRTTPVPQDEAYATHCGKIQKVEGELDLAGNAHTNWNTYRGLAESPGTYFFAEKNGARIRVKIKSARFENGQFVPETVVPEGKNEMPYAQFGA